MGGRQGRPHPSGATPPLPLLLPATDPSSSGGRRRARRSGVAPEAGPEALTACHLFPLGADWQKVLLWNKILGRGQFWSNRERGW